MAKNGSLSKIGWRRVKFGDVVRQVKVRADPTSAGLTRYIAGEHMDTDDLRIRRWGEIGDGYLGPAFHMRFRPGQVLYGSRRTYLRKVAVAAFEGICANTTFVVEPKDADVLLADYLPLVMQTEAFHQHSIKQSKGSVNPYINFVDLTWFEFGLPPVEEQRRIVQGMHAIEEQRDALDRLRDASRALLNASIDNCLSQYGDPFLRPVELLVIEGPKNGVSPKVNADSRGRPTLSISSIRNGRVESEGCLKYADISKDEASKFTLRPDDVLIVRGNGNRLLTGQCGVVDKLPEGCFYPDLLVKVRFDHSIILTRFAVAQWNSPRIHGSLVSRAKSTNGIWKINGADIRSHSLVVPPIDVQKDFLSFADAQLGGLKELGIRIMAADTLKSTFLNSVVFGAAQ